MVSTEKKALLIGVVGNFEIEASSLSSGSRILGWRITSSDLTTGLRHEFYVSEGQIHHVQFQSSPPWDHASQFVVGGKVKRIMESERAAILRAVSEFTTPSAVDAPARALPAQTAGS
jgi:hypothetical protein